MSDSHEHLFIAPGINQLEELSARLVAVNLELDRKNRELAISEQARKRILADISHDLRAPLSVVRGALDRLLGDSADEDERKRLVGVIERRMTSLEKLVGELYLAQKLDQPEFKLHTEPLAIAPFLEEYFITAETSGLFDGRDAVLTIPDGFDAVAELDAQHFLRIWDNLMSNALRHTSEGDRLELGCGTKGGQIIIYLRDSGDGVSPEDLPHIFEQTYTSFGARTPGTSGSGLGLYLARLITNKHGGEIECDSRPGEGATFTVTLPSVN